MKQTSFFTAILLVFLASIAMADPPPRKATTSFIRVTNPDNGASYSNLDNPLLIEGECSGDIVSIQIDYYFTADSGKGDSSTPSVLADSYTLQKFVAGSGRFYYRLHPSLGNLGLGTNRYTITGFTADKNQVCVIFTIFNSVFFGERAKPVIYLYPTATMDVTVKVSPKLGLTKSDPEMGQGWKVRATPGGKLTNLADSREYPYLFWESRDESYPFMHKDGFVIKQEDLESFFRGTLTQQGLVEVEIADFLQFWLPKLKQWPWYQIAYWTKAQQDDEAPLLIAPKPDTVIRVYFEYRGLEAPVTVLPQKLETAHRQGFTAVEWGGRTYR